MKSGGVSLEFYMFSCDWTLALLKDIKNIDIIQPSVTPGLLSSYLSNWSGGIAWSSTYIWSKSTLVPATQ